MKLNTLINYQNNLLKSFSFVKTLFLRFKYLRCFFQILKTMICIILQYENKSFLVKPFRVLDVHVMSECHVDVI